MANESDIQLLLDITSGGSIRDFSQLDFSNTDIHHRFAKAGNLDENDRIPLRNAKFHGTNFAHCNLSSVDFAGSELFGTNFQEALIFRGHFQNANLRYAQMRGARLIAADFQGVDLNNTDLQWADLRTANLAQANLINANLANANLLSTEIWRAYLYPVSLYPISDSSQPLEIETTGIADLLPKMQAIRDQYDDSFAYYFRGEPTTRFELRPSILRPDESSPACSESLIRFEGEMLRDLLSRHPGAFTEATTSLAQWVTARHHALPTRFLDITRNPLVGLFFACTDHPDYREEPGVIHVFATPRSLVKAFNSDTVAIVANFAKLPYDEQRILQGHYDLQIQTAEVDGHYPYHEAMGHLHQLVSREIPNFERRIEVRDLYRVIVIEPPQIQDRITAQSGAFLASAFHQNFDENKVLSHNPNIPIYRRHRITIPADCKRSIIHELESLNITRENLFPSLDEAAVAITSRYRRRLGQ